MLKNCTDRSFTCSCWPVLQRNTPINLSAAELDFPKQLETSGPQRGPPANPETASATSNGISPNALGGCWLCLPSLCHQDGPRWAITQRVFQLAPCKLGLNCERLPNDWVFNICQQAADCFTPVQSVALAVRSPSSLSTAAAWPRWQNTNLKSAKNLDVTRAPKREFADPVHWAEVPARTYLFSPNTGQSLGLMVVVQSRDSSSSNGGISLLCAT